MDYVVYKLKFTTPLHIGNDSGSATLSSAEMTIHSDTLFSALCIEALQIGGQEKLDKLFGLCKAGELLFSDLFPYKEEEYFLPKPILSVSSTKSADRDIKKRKEYKNLKYIPAHNLKNYLYSLQGQTEFDVEGINRTISSLGISEVRQMVSIKGEEETRPYHVGTYSFNDKWGLYLIVGYKNKDNVPFLTGLLESLSLSGIGGKRSAGLGKYILEDPIFLNEPYSDALEALAEHLYATNVTKHILLNVALPQDDELDIVIENGTYALVRRGGFIQSDKYGDKLLKKRLLYAFAPGSSFTVTFAGNVYDVSHQGNHPVYRNLKPLFLGVDI